MKKQYDIYQVDAFTETLFKGNPAAVVPLEGDWPEDSLLLDLAGENNLSETAYFRPREEKNEFDLRWFTPGVEVDLCGHATLATAHIVFEFGIGIAPGSEFLRFHTKSGVLEVFKEKDTYYLDFPSRQPIALEKELDVSSCFSIAPTELKQARDLLCLFEKESEVRDLVPNFSEISALPFFAAIVTAPADPGKPYDFVSRFFAPAKGVPEDPVTGSAHCTLIPYWSERLQKKNLTAYQASKRGGFLFCEDRKDRVAIGGKCRLYLEGKFQID